MTSSEGDGTPDRDLDVESYDPTSGSGGARSSAFTPAGAREWVLVEGGRLTVAALFTFGVFVLFLALNAFEVVSFVNDASVTRVASGMIAGTFSLVTLVVSINQLILSQEFATAGETRQRIEGVDAFRADVAEAANLPEAPISTAGVLESIAAAIREDARCLLRSVEHRDDEVGDRLREYGETVVKSTEDIDETFERGEPDTFTALLAAIRYDDVRLRHVGEYVRDAHAESLSDASTDAIEELIGSFELFNVARAHFKTTYLQRELTRFSQLTVYAGAPAILSAIIVGLLYADVGGASVAVESLPYVVSALIAVIVSPLALLVSYILRTATVTRRTASVGAMLAEERIEEGPFRGTSESDG
ncbi:hypothetical protein ACFQGT_16665 [Natrialbaceae archaeon GCM10025810]|uniref:hypothetical protein n=1 Tax=Halovalidus salilacus TaxID=3075124 RepID=UPI00361677DD